MLLACCCIVGTECQEVPGMEGRGLDGGDGMGWSAWVEIGLGEDKEVEKGVVVISH